ncbi:hypothetical protein M426DRAFT_28553 [Hypoxylon sp. CI-4A]|nr:hypothetical protein M426DRAFT_28553 [Hypoxylon sp. CI-4A]
MHYPKIIVNERPFDDPGNISYWDESCLPPLRKRRFLSSEREEANGDNSSTSPEARSASPEARSILPEPNSNTASIENSAESITRSYPNRTASEKITQTWQERIRLQKLSKNAPKSPDPSKRYKSIFR